MKNIVVVIAFIISFILGFMCHKLVSKNENTDSSVLKNKIDNTNSNSMKKVQALVAFFLNAKTLKK